MRYLVNPRGRCIEMSDQEAEKALIQGFIEISKDDYAVGKYFPEYDKGEHTHSPVPFIETTPSHTYQERSTFTTTIV